MCATFNGNIYTIIISCCYPTYVSNERDIAFKNELYSLIWYIPKYNILIMSGNMNTQIGKAENNKFC